MNFLKSKHDIYSAKVVDGKLILSFPGAITPVVWQMDFTETKSTALQVENKEEQATLIMKAPKKAAIEIAQFASEREAVKALMAASKAMENAVPNIITSSHMPVSQQTLRVKRGLFKTFFMWIGGLAIIFVAFSFFIALTGRTPRISPVSPPQQNTASQDGQPMSADDFLRGR